MAAAGSLDEVMEVHEAYLMSIQRQCFIVPDKLVGGLFSNGSQTTIQSLNFLVCERMRLHVYVFFSGL